jgi:S-layer family protein
MDSRIRTGAARHLLPPAFAALLLLLAAPGHASDLAVNAGARYFGAFGLQVNVAAAGPAYVEDDSPGVERRYRARFYVNANGLTLASGDEFELFSAYSAAGVRQLSVLLGRSGTLNRLRLSARRDDGVYVETPAGSEAPFPREWHTVEIDWKAATSASSGDGALALWVDGKAQPGLTGLENDQGQVGLARLGAVAGLDPGTTGSFVVDEFDSRRDTYVGALSVFQDVPLSHPLWRYAHSLYNAGVTSGCGASAYCPDASVTRDQMSVFLLRAKDGSAYLPSACTTAPFGDVPVSSPFCRWIRELVARGVTSGCGGGNYCPTAAVTRAQMSVFLLVTLEGPAYQPPACTTAPFTDVPAGDPFCRWIRELVSRGITAGCGGGNYCPGAAVTRGQMAVFLPTTFGLIVPLP